MYLKKEKKQYFYLEYNTYYDQLAQRSTDAGVESKTAARDIEYYTKEIEKLQNDTISTAEKEAATNDVTSLIDTIKTKMNKWINITNTAVEEYYEKTLHNTAIKYRQTPENYSPVGDLKMTLAIAAVLGLMLGSFIVFIRAYLKKNKPVRVLKSAK
jgi:flagellar hook-associated protein FlgK